MPAPSEADAQSRKQSKTEEDRRTHILRTTLKVIAEGGVDCVTHRRVADAAGIPLGSTTYYFDSRQHLLRDAFDYYLEQSKVALKRLSDSLAADTVEDLVSFLVTLSEREYAGAPLLLAEYELTLFAARDHVIAKSLHEWDAFIMAHFGQLLQQVGVRRDLSDAARTALQLIRGYELDRLSHHQPDSADLKRRMAVVISAYVD